jgi:hypothetical protein
MNRRQIAARARNVTAAMAAREARGRGLPGARVRGGG